MCYSMKQQLIVPHLSSKENVQLCAVYLEKKKKKEPVGKERAPYVKRKEEGG